MTASPGTPHPGPPLQNGQLLTPEHAAATPRATVKSGSEGGLYTLIASDPDPPGGDGGCGAHVGRSALCKVHRGFAVRESDQG